MWIHRGQWSLTKEEKYGDMMNTCAAYRNSLCANLSHYLSLLKPTSDIQVGTPWCFPGGAGGDAGVQPWVRQLQNTDYEIIISNVHITQNLNEAKTHLWFSLNNKTFLRQCSLPLFDWSQQTPRWFTQTLTSAWAFEGDSQLVVQ